MEWKLDQRFPYRSDPKLWEEDLLRAASLFSQGDREQAEQLASYLWVYAQARSVRDTREVEWFHRKLRVEDLEADWGEENEEADSSGDEEYEEVYAKHQQMMDELRQKRFGELTLFQAGTSSAPALRAEAFAYSNTMFDAKQDLVTDLIVRLSRQSLPEDAAYQRARARMLQELPGFREFFARRVKALGGEKISWQDLLYTVDSKLNENSLEQSVRMARDYYREMDGRFGIAVDELFDSGSVEVGDGHYKAQAAFSMPVAFHSNPLVYMHSVRGKEGMMGLVHELAHGVHFAMNRHTRRNDQLPHHTVLEVFPMMNELIAIHRWDGQEAYWQRLTALVAVQFLWVEFKQRVHEASVNKASDVQEIWDDLCELIFGDALQQTRGTNRVWCGNRLLFEEADVGRSYVLGGLNAWQLAEQALSGSTAVFDRLAVAMALPPDCTVDDWKQKTGLDLIGST